MWCWSHHWSIIHCLEKVISSTLLLPISINFIGRTYEWSHIIVNSAFCCFCACAWYISQGFSFWTLSLLWFHLIVFLSNSLLLIISSIFAYVPLAFLAAGCCIFSVKVWVLLSSLKIVWFHLHPVFTVCCYYRKHQVEDNCLAADFSYWAAVQDAVSLLKSPLMIYKWNSKN